jgi:hypothetical protein
MAILPAVLLAQAIEQTHRTVARKLVALGLRELTSAADPEIISSIIVGFSNRQTPVCSWSI